jgi:hypothetical protein
MFDPQRFIDLVKTTPRHAYIGLISCAILYLLPVWGEEKEYRNLLAFFAVPFFSICVVHIAICVWSVIQEERKKRADRLAKEKIIKSISKAEKSFVRPYFRSGMRTLNLGLEMPEVQRLVHSGIIYQTTARVQRTVNCGTLLADFSVSDWAWEAVNDNPSLREWVLSEEK